MPPKKDTVGYDDPVDGRCWVSRHCLDILQPMIPSYLDAQSKGTLGKFWAEAYDKYFASVRLDLRLFKKTFEELDKEELSSYSTAVQNRRLQIQRWFAASTNGDKKKGSSAVYKIIAKQARTAVKGTRALSREEVFSSQFYSSRILAACRGISIDDMELDIIDCADDDSVVDLNADEDSTDAFPMTLRAKVKELVGSKTPTETLAQFHSRRWAIYRKIRDKAYAQATPAQLAEVERIYQENTKEVREAKARVEEDLMNADDIGMRLRAIEGTVDSLREMLKALNLSTGFYFSVNFGGVSPQTGKISVGAVHVGTTSDGQKFSNYHPGYKEHVIVPFNNFLRVSFPAEKREEIFLEYKTYRNGPVTQMPVPIDQTGELFAAPSSDDNESDAAGLEQLPSSPDPSLADFEDLSPFEDFDPVGDLSNDLASGQAAQRDRTPNPQHQVSPDRDPPTHHSLHVPERPHTAQKTASPIPDDLIDPVLLALSQSGTHVPNQHPSCSAPQLPDNSIVQPVRPHGTSRPESELARQRNGSTGVAGQSSTTAVAKPSHSTPHRPPQRTCGASPQRRLGSALQNSPSKVPSLDPSSQRLPNAAPPTPSRLSTIVPPRPVPKKVPKNTKMAKAVTPASRDTESPPAPTLVPIPSLPLDARELPETCPKEFVTAVKSWAGRNLGKEFEDCALAWIDLEEATGWRTNCTTLSIPKRQLENDIGQRPSQIAYWTGRHRDIESIPPIEEPREYRKKVTQWWNQLQPEWRRSDSQREDIPASIYTPPASCDWGKIDSQGPNGMFTVLLALSWAGVVEGQGGEKWKRLLIDVKMALKGVLHFKARGGFDGTPTPPASPSKDHEQRNVLGSVSPSKSRQSHKQRKRGTASHTPEAGRAPIKRSRRG